MRHQIALLLLSAGGLVTGFARAAAGEPDGWISLFDGKTLAGWRTAGVERTFRVADGHIVAEGPCAGLSYGGRGRPLYLRNFEFRADVLTKPGTNFAISLLPAGAKGAEVGIRNSVAPARGSGDLWKTGSLLRLRPQLKPLVRDDQWFTLRAVVRGRRVQVYVDAVLATDFPLPADDAAAGPWNGPLELVNCWPGQTWLRNLRIKPLPDEPAATAAAKPDAADSEIQRLLADDFPLADFHIHLKGGLTLDEALAQSRRKGIFYGIAANCGLGFPIHDDRGAQEYLRQLAGQPCFIGMQAEGREWPRLVSKETIAKFDYVFTDAMTIVDHRGRRARLWIKEEVDIPDREQFMELLVRTIEDILRHEPIDIYANPTYLPDVIAADYDRLWTPERQRRVLRAAAENGVAIEISNRLRLPKPEFIKAAKAAGIRFTLGTNNTDRELGREEYGLQMIRQCGLTWQDMWMPKPEGRKPIQVKNR
ncbi:MAG: family 16 glycoside hydrolase [Thermoguttaceae bacterium]|jgi:hypothetical protein